MNRVACLFVLLTISAVVFAADPVPNWFMHVSTDNFGASGAGYSPGSNVWHCGWDILCPEGTPVKAIADGRVVASSPGGWDDQGRNENYGLLIEHQAQSGERFIAIYGHLKRGWNEEAHRLLTDQEVRGYRVGLSVTEGDTIGKIGAYSHSHLHLAIYFDPNRPGQFPASGYGRQPLPRPEAASYRGVVSYGNWRSPRGWLTNFTMRSAGHDDTLPTGTSDNTRVFFVRSDDAGLKLASTGVDGGEVITHLTFEPGSVVDALFAGEGNTIYVVTHVGREYTLSHYTGGELRQIYTQTYSFDLGNWREGKNHLPILRGLEWEALDLESGQVKPRSEYLGGTGSGWQSIFFGQRELWRLLGDSLDLRSGHFRPTSWVLSASQQTKRQIAGIPAGDCRGLIVFDTKFESDNGCERIAFGQLVGTSYRLQFARLRPKPDVESDGYTAEEITTSNVFPAGQDVIPHSTVFDQRSEEFALVQVKMAGQWRIFRINPWGVFKALSD